jgi:hypothetical protein
LRWLEQVAGAVLAHEIRHGPRAYGKTRLGAVTAEHPPALRLAETLQVTTPACCTSHGTRLVALLRSMLMQDDLP